MKRDKSFIVKHDFLFNSRIFVQIMKNMRNIVDAIIEIVNAPQYRLKEYAESHNRANQMGAALEEYVKYLFAGTVNETDLNKRNQKISESFCYLGNQNNPPDSMLKNGGVAIEVKKIESPNSALALNSSYPKAKLYSDCEMINRACRFCEPWEVRDMLYVVGVLNGEVLTSLAFVYGDEYCADKEIYERIKKKLKEGILSIPNVEFADTKELGRVNRVDPLGITSLRIRGMWQIDNPFVVFNYLYRRDSDKKFNFLAIINEKKAASLDNFWMLEKLQQEKKDFSISNAQIKNPNNPAILQSVKLITYTI